jgi:hypothetical protein
LAVGSIITAIRASSNDLICNLATLQIIVVGFVIQFTWVDLHADASGTTWVKSSQLSKMRVKISTGMETMVVFWIVGEVSRKLENIWGEVDAQGWKISLTSPNPLVSV